MLQMLIVGAVLALVHWLFYRRFVRATELTGTWRIAGITLLISFWILGVIAIGAGNSFSSEPLRPLVWLGQAWFAVAFYLALGLIVIGVILLGARLARYSKRIGLLQVLSAVLVVASIGTVTYGAFEANAVRVVATELQLDNLPPQLDGLRVAMVGDIHVGAARGPEFARRVVDLVNAEKPDLIVLPGDLIDGSVELVGPDIEPISRLRAKYGIFAVAGNHEGYVDDVAEWMDYWETLGVTTLRNSGTQLTINDATIDIAGVYDFDAPDPYGPDLDAATARHLPDRFLMLLAHQPRQAQSASERGVDLQLSGHTHGGQIGPLNSVVKWINGTGAGPTTVGEMQLYTTIGAGAWGPPIRVGARPEVSILTLRSD